MIGTGVLCRIRLRRAVLSVGIAVAGAVFLGAAAAALLWCEMRPPGGPDRSRTVVVPPGETTWQIGRRLAEARVVRSARAVVIAARLRRVDGRLRSGEYALSPAQSAWQIVGVLARGEAILHRITIPEGFTAAQIADALAEAGLADRDRFLDLALRSEGYLFPDTYLLPRGLGEPALVARFLGRFDAVIGADLREAARARGLSLHQLVTVASMIEREARVPEERAVIAGVIYNRLRLGMRLEIDATVLYALGRHKAELALADLAVDSPYNTYRNPGLPPGPIANPGLAAVAAAAAPAETPFLYYVLRPDGSHHFSRTLREHQDAIIRYRR
ncbi:MAG: endolytic transglycosylase MltG [Armatimonadetes bacterium]|nr:endolytic transglycosylase MltG [Armatimonadota bacterium]